MREKYWPLLAQLTGPRFRKERLRWAVALQKVSDRAGVDFWVLTRWDKGGPDVVSEEFRRRVYFALRDLVLQKARGLVLVLESIEGAANPPPLAGFSTERVSADDTPSFLRRNSA